MTATREKAVKTTEVADSARIGKNKKESKDKYLENLAQVLCICYLINFWKKSVFAFFDLGSKVNAIYLAFIKELALSIRPIDVGV